MLSFLAVVALSLGQADSTEPGQSPAELAFRTFLDMQTDWSGKITIGEKEVTVTRLDVVSKMFCNICGIHSVVMNFQFEGEYKLPVVPESELPMYGNRRQHDFLRAIKPEAVRVQSQFHGHHLVQLASGSELVLTTWKRSSDEDITSAYEFTLGFWKHNALHESIEFKGRLTIKDGRINGTLSGKDMPPVKFAFTPIPKNEPEKKE